MGDRLKDRLKDHLKDRLKDHLKDRLHLYHTLDKLRLPDGKGKTPVFSIEFVVSQGKKKGQIRFIEEAVINYFSKGRNNEVYEAQAGKVSVQSVSKRETYNHQDAGVIAIRVVQSNHYAPNTVLTPKKIFITRIDGLKTFI